MSRTQATVIGMLLGIVALVFIGLVLVLFIPVERALPASPTRRPSAPAIIPTATFPNFMPTAGLETPTPAEPTPTNTRLPTLTPTQPKPSTPTVVFNLPEPKPTATPIPAPTRIPVPTATPTVRSPSPVPRQYTISFEADDSKITEGDCTDLKWEVMGASSVQLNGQSVSPSGKKEVCPNRDTEYRLTIQFPDRAELENRTVKISVEEEE
ncbi:MAG: hypothetical protein AB1801_07340 [Chloroflexota bacterium]